MNLCFLFIFIFLMYFCFCFTLWITCIFGKLSKIHHMTRQSVREIKPTIATTSINTHREANLSYFINDATFQIGYVSL